VYCVNGCWARNSLFHLWSSEGSWETHAASGPLGPAPSEKGGGKLFPWKMSERYLIEAVKMFFCSSSAFVLDF